MTVTTDLEPLLSLGREILAAALRAADPQAFTTAALERTLSGRPPGGSGRLRVIALGKAAPAMTAATVAFAGRNQLTVAGGIVVSASEGPAAGGVLHTVAGDHPLPGERSRRTAELLGEAAGAVDAGDLAVVLVSGGTSSLVGAPIDGVAPADLAELHELLLGSGLDIVRLNAVRKRFARWGAGRLAAALARAPVQPILLSDVPGDDPSAIGSGPCAPDPTTAADIEAILRDAGIARRVPLALASHLAGVRAGTLPETPKPGSPVFRRVRAAIVGGNRTTLDAAAASAARAMPNVRVEPEPLTGDAATAGTAIARAALAAPAGCCLLFGGETSVRLPEQHGVGGRSQQLALAAAGTLARAGAGAPRVVVLAAGTDGRDGPTDAAGAVVSNGTWPAIRNAGLDPEAHVALCDAYPALDAVGALLRTGPTGTNVADIVIALRA